MNDQPDQARFENIKSVSGILSPGVVLGAGRYTLIRPLGRGGMGVVWLADDGRLGEKVALKFLPPEIPNDPVALDDMRRETAKSRRLTHSHIIRIHDFYDSEGEAFVSMEYVDGPNLAFLRLEQPDRVFTWAFLAPIITQLCQALEYAHNERTIHRDLKPANMMLDSKGRLKLADFGIAAVVDEAAGRISVKHTTSGTLAYMSPQQMDGQVPRVTDDIYALGATLYELLTGKPPFYAGDVPHQARTLPATPLQERLEEFGMVNQVPPTVAAMIMACLAKDSSHRPQSAREIAEWIGLEVGMSRSLSEVEAITKSPEPPRRTKLWKLAVTGGILLLLAATMGGWLWYDHRRRTNALGAEAARERLTLNAAAASDAAAKLAAQSPPTLSFKLTNLIWIPSGTFLMGSTDDDPDRSINETPQTEVTISHGFWLGKFEVTQGEYLSLMSTNPSRFVGDLNRPVERVGWDAASKYCEALTMRSRQSKHLPEGYVYRLPTEAEWEYAARAGTTNRFSFGEDASVLADYAWYADNSGNTTHLVGQKKPNPWGFYDMYGNVWEWCNDWKGTYDGGKVTDPTGSRAGSFRVNRGGCWYDLPSACRSANRFNLVGAKGFDFIGFRVALAPPIQR